MEENNAYDWVMKHPYQVTQSTIKALYAMSSAQSGPFWALIRNEVRYLDEVQDLCPYLVESIIIFHKNIDLFLQLPCPSYETAELVLPIKLLVQYLHITGPIDIHGASFPLDKLARNGFLDYSFNIYDILSQNTSRTQIIIAYGKTEDLISTLEQLDDWINNEDNDEIEGEYISLYNDISRVLKIRTALLLK